MNRITKAQITKRINLSKRVEGELRDMKILTAFKKNVVEFTHRRWRLLKKSSEVAAQTWVEQQLKRINSDKLSTLDAIDTCFLWSNSIEGRTFWSSQSAKAEDLEY